MARAAVGMLEAALRVGESGLLRGMSTEGRTDEVGVPVVVEAAGEEARGDVIVAIAEMITCLALALF